MFVTNIYKMDRIIFVKETILYIILYIVIRFLYFYIIFLIIFLISWSWNVTNEWLENVPSSLVKYKIM